jgi:hypothetical protein
LAIADCGLSSGDLAIVDLLWIVDCGFRASESTFTPDNQQFATANRQSKVNPQPPNHQWTSRNPQSRVRNRQ